MAFLSFIFCAHCLEFQRGAVGVQRPDGLHHGSSADVELRSGRNDLHPLERSIAAAAGLSHYDQCADGTCVHQVPA